MRARLAFLPYALLLCAWPLMEAQEPAKQLSSMDDLVRAGIANNKDLAAVRERISEAKGLLRQAGVRPVPALVLSGSTASPFGTSGEDEYGAELSQSLETAGKRSKRMSVAQVSVGLAEAELQERSAELAFQIKTAYGEVLAERRKLKILSDLIAVNQQTLKLTEARVQEGDVARLEAELLKVEISRGNVSQVSVQGRLASAELELRRLVGVGHNTAIPEGEFSPPATISLEALQRRALENRPDLKIARLEESQRTAEVALAKAEAKPDVTVSAGYLRRHSQFDGLFGVTSNGALSPIRDQVDVLAFGLSIPLRTASSNAGNVQSATARTSAARLHREYLESSVPVEVEAAYQRWRTAVGALEMLQTAVIAPSAANLSVIREAYKLGQLRLLDVLNEQRRLVDTELGQVDAQVDAARTWAEVERSVGGNLP